MSPDNFSRGDAAKAALSVFYENFNDLDVYIEDTADGYDKIFSRLLSRALEGRVTIDRVFPLGERSKVIKSARLYDRGISERASVFIVDGDLYLLSGEKEQLPHNLIVLPRYCIENFLFDKASFLQLLDEEDTAKDTDVLESALDLNNWLDHAGIELRPLFCIFAVAHFLESGIKTVKNGSTGICQDQFGNIDAIKVQNLTNTIHQELSDRYGVCVIEMLLRSVEAKISPDLCFASTYVSGKDFILPLLFLRLRSISGSKTKNINLKIRLASKCRTDVMEPVTSKIRAAMAA